MKFATVESWQFYLRYLVVALFFVYFLFKFNYIKILFWVVDHESQNLSHMLKIFTLCETTSKSGKSKLFSTILVAKFCFYQKLSVIITGFRFSFTKCIKFQWMWRTMGSVCKLKEDISVEKKKQQEEEEDYRLKEENKKLLNENTE